MCSSKQIISPSNVLFDKKTKKYADPLGLTKTAIGDPTGRIRKGHAQQAKEDAAWEAYENPKAPTPARYDGRMMDLAWYQRRARK